MKLPRRLPLFRQHRRGLHARQLGLSLVELMVAGAVTSIVTAVAVPSLAAMQERVALRQAAAQFEADVMLARSSAASSGQSRRIGFERTGTHSCYVVHTGGAGDCSCLPDGSASCQGDARAERVAAWATGERVSVRANVRSALVDAQRGTVSPTMSVRFEARSGQIQQQVVNILGRVRSCSPNGLPGLPRC
jgi:type IV fimbrial biogenesis protein FimT